MRRYVVGPQRVLVFGKGGISEGIREALPGHEVIQIPKEVCDVRDLYAVRFQIRHYEPQWVVNCAGVSSPEFYWDEIETNLTGAINVALASREHACILIASVAGLYGKPGHLGYSASKAGVISVVQSLGFSQPIYAVSPGRVDTPLRERDYPNDTPGSRLHPYQVGLIISQIMDGKYASGTNVVIRKVGLTEVVIEEHRGDGWREKLQVGEPVTI